MAMNISESSIPQTRTSAIRSNSVADDTAASQSAAIAVEEVAQSYENYQKAKEKRQAILLNHNAQEPMPKAAQTALNDEETALWLFENAVRKKGHELPEDQLAFCNQVIGSASSSVASSTTSEDTFSLNNTDESKKNGYIDTHKREAEAARIRLLVMIMINNLGKSVEALRTSIAKLTTTYTGGDTNGVHTDFKELIDMCNKILLSNDGKPGLPGNGIIKDKDGNNLNFKDKESAQKYAEEKYGAIAKAKEEPPGSGKWVASLDVQAVKDLKELFIKQDEKQTENGKSKKGPHLTPEEHASMETAIRGIFAGWDGNVTASSQLASQHQQGFDTMNKLLSTLMSNDHDEISRILSRI